MLDYIGETITVGSPIDKGVISDHMIIVLKPEPSAYYREILESEGRWNRIGEWIQYKSLQTVIEKTLERAKNFENGGLPVYFQDSYSHKAIVLWHPEGWEPKYN